MVSVKEGLHGTGSPTWQGNPSLFLILLWTFLTWRARSLLWDRTLCLIGSRIRTRSLNWSDPRSIKRENLLNGISLILLKKIFIRDGLSVNRERNFSILKKFSRATRPTMPIFLILNSL